MLFKDKDVNDFMNDIYKRAVELVARKAVVELMNHPDLHRIWNKAVMEQQGYRRRIN